MLSKADSGFKGHECTPTFWLLFTPLRLWVQFRKSTKKFKSQDPFPNSHKGAFALLRTGRSLLKHLCHTPHATAEGRCPSARPPRKIALPGLHRSQGRICPTLGVVAQNLLFFCSHFRKMNRTNKTRKAKQTPTTVKREAQPGHLHNYQTSRNCINAG